MNQTYLTTTVPSWQTHTRIHLEKALKISDRLHGHIVQGHIDTTTHLTKRHTQNHTLYLHFYLHSRFSKYIVEHGSICIDGVSLTIANFTEGDFGVALIDMTIKSTTLGDLRIGGHVNIEFDIVGKYIQKMLIHSSEKSEISEEWLKKNGF
jgi:riboflavin synthase